MTFKLIIPSNSSFLDKNEYFVDGISFFFLATTCISWIQIIIIIIIFRMSWA